ncbi:MAG: hypothetical protein JSS82_05785 [Bacteroidetes bacterium]|nr:hypothetical protein [Bacteroidota bacterium]
MLTKNALLLSAAMLFCVSFTNKATAQGSNNTKTIQVGNLNSGKHSTAAAVLSQSKLEVTDKNFFVSGYSVSLKDAKTSQVYFGPVAVKGAGLTQELKDQLKKYEHNNCNLVIDNVQVMGQGLMTKGNNISLALDAAK